MHNFIRDYNLFPEKSRFEGAWPWPVKIYSLGKFELVLEGKPVRFSGRVQRKPLQMLKMLVALGGTEVREEQLTDLLWPEADGDRAHSAFTTTLMRLRRFLGLDKAIEIYAGKASLNPHLCWLDTWAFEEIYRQVDSLLEIIDELRLQTKENRQPVIQLAERAIKMYGGPLFPDEASQLWVLPLRERLKDRFNWLIARLGSHFEADEQWEKAAKYYQAALEIDGAADEELYRRLMVCHHRLDEPAKVVEAYRRCSKTLAAMLGIKPSPKTEIIYKDLIHSMEMGKEQRGLV